MRRPDLLATPARRAWLFAALYFFEGAPIGFVWWTLPVLLRRAGSDAERIGALLALVVLPWSAKVVVGPLVDIGRGRRWTERGWIVSAQVVMALGLAPLLAGAGDVASLTPWLLLHAAAAATQDVAIDALAVRSTGAAERATVHAAMNAGMLSGRALLGGGAVWLLGRGGEDVARNVVAALVVGLLVLGPALALLYLPVAPAAGPSFARARDLARRLGALLASRGTWGLAAFAVLGGCGFEGLGVLLGPFVLDHGASEEELGLFFAFPAWMAPVLGGFLGARLAQRRGKVPAVVAGSLAVATGAVAVAVLAHAGADPRALFAGLAAVYVAIGAFTASSYSLFMDHSPAAVGSTAFSAFMGLTNLCESWSAASAGALATRLGYPSAFAVLAGISLLALAFLPRAAPAAPRA